MEEKKEQTQEFNKKNIITGICAMIFIIVISYFVFSQLIWENKFDLIDVGFADTNDWISGPFSGNADLRYESGYLEGTIVNKTNKRYEVTITVDFYDDIKDTGKTGTGTDTLNISYNESEKFMISIPKYTSNYKIRKISFKQIR